MVDLTRTLATGILPPLTRTCLQTRSETFLAELFRDIEHAAYELTDIDNNMKKRRSWLRTLCSKSPRASYRQTMFSALLLLHVEARVARGRPGFMPDTLQLRQLAMKETSWNSLGYAM